MWPWRIRWERAPENKIARGGGRQTPIVSRGGRTNNKERNPGDLVDGKGLNGFHSTLCLAPCTTSSKVRGPYKYETQPACIWRHLLCFILILFCKESHSRSFLNNPISSQINFSLVYTYYMFLSCHGATQLKTKVHRLLLIIELHFRKY